MQLLVLSKRSFAERYNRCSGFAQSEFGNASSTWNNYDDWLAGDCRSGLFHIRNRVAGGPTFYKVEPDNMEATWQKALRIQPASLWYISEQVPEYIEKSLRLQGEVMLAPWGYELTYSTVRKPMRDALAEQTLTTRGLRALLLLQYAMDAVSYDWLQVMLDRYAGHVIEFSSYDYTWGTLAWNTIFWECRLY